MALRQKDTFVSIKTVIAKVYRDLNLQEEDRFYDIIEWIAEALELISSPNHLITPKPKTIKIENHRGSLPCGLVEILQVNHCGIPLKSATSTFGTTFFKDNDKRNVMPPFDKIFPDNEMITDLGNNRRGREERYEISDGWIKTSFRDGEVIISYKSIPVDEEGYPMVPNEANTTNALFWYVTKMLILGGYNNPGISFQFAHQMWEKYCGQAFTKSIAPTLDQLENIKISYLSLKPSLQAYDRFFSDLNNKRGIFSR